MQQKKPHTHTAWAYERLGKKHGRLLECGTGFIDHERNSARIYMDRQPIGGYTGFVMLLPHGAQPEPPKPVPQRPGEDEDDEEDQGGGED